MQESGKRDRCASPDLLENPDKMIRNAEAAARTFANSVRSRFFVEADDLAGPAIMAGLAGRPMKLGIIDELRRIGGRDVPNAEASLRRGSHRTNFLLSQFPENAVVGIGEPKYIAQLALKKCGVLMLDCLPEKLRRVIMLRYWHGLTQIEVGREMGFALGKNGRNCGRVSQLEMQACALIAAELKRRGIRSMRDVM